MAATLLSFATPNFYYAKSTLIRSAKKFGFTDIKTYSDSDFAKTSFYRQYANITKQSRGAGYWLWKPFYIYQTLKSLNNEDVLVYCDSGVDIVASLIPLIEISKNNKTGIVLFENYQGSAYFPKTKGVEVNEYNLYIEVNKNKYWAKRDVFVLMGLDSEEYWNSPQVNANLQIYRKTESSLAFVEEWLKYCCDEQILTDAKNICGLPDFKNMFSHIHDQAIISLLAHKYKLELFRCPSQFGNHYKDEYFWVKDEFLLLPYATTAKSNSHYGTLTHHHRTKFMPYWFRYKSFFKQEIDILKSYFIKKNGK